MLNATRVNARPSRLPVPFFASRTVFLLIPWSRAIQQSLRSSRLRPGKPRFHVLADQVAFDLSDPHQLVAIIRPSDVSRSKMAPFIATTETFHPACRCSVSSRSRVYPPHRESSETRTASRCRVCARSITCLGAARLGGRLSGSLHIRYRPLSSATQWPTLSRVWAVGAGHAHVPRLPVEGPSIGFQRANDRARN